MSRISPIDPVQASAETKDMLNGVQQTLGMTPNLFTTLARSPAALKAYLGFSGSLGGGQLPASLREQIALAVGESNECDYCVAAHNTLGKAAGLSENQAQDARRGKAEDEKTAVALLFVKNLVKNRGRIGDSQLNRVRNSGFSDGEIVAHVALNLFTNYFNLVAETEVDFPQPKAVAAAH